MILCYMIWLFLPSSGKNRLIKVQQNNINTPIVWLIMNLLHLILFIFKMCIRHFWIWSASCCINIEILYFPTENRLQTVIFLSKKETGSSLDTHLVFPDENTDSCVDGYHEYHDSQSPKRGHSQLLPQQVDGNANLKGCWPQQEYHLHIVHHTLCVHRHQVNYFSHSEILTSCNRQSQSLQAKTYIHMKIQYFLFQLSSKNTNIKARK